MAHFSKSEIQEISNRLSTIGLKDTDFIEAQEVHDEDIVAIVQDNQNKKIRVDNFLAPYALITLLGSYDLISTSEFNAIFS